MRLFWDNGKVRWIVVKDGTITEAMKDIAAPKELERFFELARANSNFWRMLLTVFNVGFQINNIKRTALHLQGLRAARTYALNPKTRGGFIFRLLLRHGFMKSLYVAAGAGFLDALSGFLTGDDDEDERQKDFQEWIRRTSPYKREQDDVLFLGWLRPDGGVEPPWGHSVIPEDWRPISPRLGFSEEGRILGPLSAITLSTLAEKMGMDSGIAPLEPGKEYARAFKNWLVPAWNPVGSIISVGANAMTSDSPPIDDWRGRPIASRDEWEAGPESRAFVVLRHAVENTPILGTDLSGSFGLKPAFDGEIPGWFGPLMRLPGARAILSVDNYQRSSDRAREQMEERKISARARLMRGDMTARAVRRHEQLERMGAPDSDKRNPRNGREQREYEILHQWYRDYYQGTPDSPGLFSVLKARAAGDKEADAEYAKRRLEETAKEAWEAAKGR